MKTPTFLAHAAVNHMHVELRYVYIMGIWRTKLWWPRRTLSVVHIDPDVHLAPIQNSWSTAVNAIDMSTKPVRRLLNQELIEVIVS